MRVSLIAVVSANGKIAKDSSLTVDWNSHEDLEWFKKVTMDMGTVIVGRKTFELIGKPLPKRLNVVMTRKKIHEEGNNNVIFTAQEPTGILNFLKNSGREKVAVIGGKEIFSLFLKEKLIDEMYITYEPILFDGIDLFENVDYDIRLRTEEIRRLKSGAIVVHYTLKNGDENERI